MKEHYGVLYPDLGGSYIYTHAHGHAHTHDMFMYKTGIAIDRDI